MPFIGFPKAELHTENAFRKDAEQTEKLVQLAIAEGMPSIGFLARSRVSFLSEGMTPPEERLYREEIARLKARYTSQIHVFCGVDQDYDADLPPLGYDFVVGRVSYLRVKDAYCAVSDPPRILRQMIDRHFASDAYAFLRAYTEALADLPERTACDVVAGIENVLQWSGEGRLFEGRDVRFRKYVLDALDALLEKDAIFEIDTARFLADVRRSSRSYLLFLRYLAEKRGRLTLTAGVVKTPEEKRAFAQAAHLCRSVGIGSVARLTPNGWQSVGL